MSFRVIFDDTQGVSEGVRALLGIESFGSLIHRRRTLLQSLRAVVAAAGIDGLIEIDDAGGWTALEARLRNGEWANDNVLVCRSDVVSSAGSDALTLFLRQAAISPVSLVLPPANGHDWDGWMLLNPVQFRDYLRMRIEDDLAAFFDRYSRELVRVTDRLGMISLNDEVVLLDYLAGAYDVRFFNALERDAYTIAKRSTSRDKLRQEHDFYGLLPPLMRMFFVEPFDFTDDGATASYRMERLYVPDMAIQWLHGALKPNEFARFLEQIFHFVTVRKPRAAARAEVDAVADTLYIEKVVRRIAEFKAHARYAVLGPIIDHQCGGIDALLGRYLDLFATHRKRGRADELVIGHGDLCFSNILYGKASQTLKLIDPRGASSEAQLYTDRHYDVAKLSHSVLGAYDFINHDMFELQTDEDLRLRLLMDRHPIDWAQRQFLDRVRAAGFDPLYVRLCEAGLFISMLPLHMDRPRKVLGFVINAVAILDSVESGKLI